MGEKVFIADKPTLDQVAADVKKVASALSAGDRAIYGMVIHEDVLDPNARVEYLGANKDFAPMSMDFGTHRMSYGGWSEWGWLKSNVPVMAHFDGQIDYYLDPNDYTKKTDGTASDVSNEDYAGDAMAVVRKIYKKEYKSGTDRYVYFCESRVDEGFLPVGFDVLGKEREYMLIPMFYGSIDKNGKMRSIAGQWSCLTASGAHADVTGKLHSSLAESAGVTTDLQHKALTAAHKDTLFFGGALTNTLADILTMLTKSTDSQGKLGNGVLSYVNDAGSHYGTRINEVVGGGQFYGSNDSKNYCKALHSAVLASCMIWQRDPYMLLVEGRLKVSPGYAYDVTGATYHDTGIDFKPGEANRNFFQHTEVVPGYGIVPKNYQKNKATTATGYCDGVWANASGTRGSLRFGCADVGADGGLFARTLVDGAGNAGWSCGASKLLPGPAAALAAE